MKCLGDYPLRLGFGLPRTILPDLREEGKRAMLPRIPPFIMFSCHSQGHQLASRRVNVFNRIRSDGALKRATPGFLKCQCHAVAWFELNGCIRLILGCDFADVGAKSTRRFDCAKGPRCAIGF
jgi:hypothetical protein